ncbi:MAG: efflux RND transporter permease subunit [Mucinivorans sp.]
MKKLSSFSVILSMVVLMIIGAAMIPLLGIQYQPTKKSQSLSVSYSWSGASARVVEQEITSKLEGLFAPILGVSGISSVSFKDGGSINIDFKEDANLDALRFEISSKIRQIYPSLPSGSSYPSLSSSTTGEYTPPMLTYTINADLPTWQIQEYAKKGIADPLSRIEGVKQVNVSGATPFEWVITFDPERCKTAGISPREIQLQIINRISQFELGNITANNNELTRVILRSGEAKIENWGEIPIKNIAGRIITLSDIATIDYSQALPTYYYRLNGLNNINLTITPEKHVNTLRLSDEIKEQVAQIEKTLPTGYSLSLVSDSSVYIRGELNKIYLRSGLSLLILLLFVFLVSRSLRYLLLIVITLTANILIAFIFYNIFSLEIHLYSLAGITVSLGLIIDTSIIMIDHYGRYRNLKVFIAILAALLTTIGALSIVLFLPADQRANLVDFSAVIVINLAVSMFVSLFFIPALLGKLPVGALTRRRKSSKRLRRVAKITELYRRWILWSKRHKWIYITALILGFGIPVQLLPIKLGQPEYQGQPVDSLDRWQKFYNSTIGGELYQTKIKKWLEPALGGSMRLFAKSALNGEVNFRDENERTYLSIKAALPEGCTIHQLNDAIGDMEILLSGYKEVEAFQTMVSAYNNAQITVTFTPEAEKSAFPYMLKNIATSKATALGGATWGIYGVGQGFSNNVSSGWKSNRIELAGYNYEQLYRYAKELADTLSLNPRVSGVEIAGDINWGSSSTFTEFYLDFNFEKFALYGVNPSEYYSAIEQNLFRTSLPSIYREGVRENVVLVSAGAEEFDVWHLGNDILKVGEHYVKLSELGSIAKRRSGNNIYKTNQEYTLLVAFDFVGSQNLASRVTKRNIDKLRATLPLGYKVKEQGWGWWSNNLGVQYALILLIIAIIYFICSVLFESLLQPLVIILMIPVSFIGVFLTFWLFDLKFGQGGFASFVLLCGLVVNAGIYVINEYNRVGNYLRAFNRKIVPILLTITSTVLGMIPFVVVSREPFWFSFATGVMGGMIFSVTAIFIVMPIFLKIGNKQGR